MPITDRQFAKPTDGFAETVRAEFESFANRLGFKFDSEIRRRELQFVCYSMGDDSINVENGPFEGDVAILGLLTWKGRTRSRKVILEAGLAIGTKCRLILNVQSPLDKRELGFIDVQSPSDIRQILRALIVYLTQHPDLILPMEYLEQQGIQVEKALRAEKGK